MGRLLNYLLVPIYTRIFAPGDYGVVSEFYAYITFLMVILALGLETAFFHFVNKKQNQNTVFGNAQFTLMCSTGFITILLLLFSHPIATFLGYPDHAEYVQWFALIMAFDTLTMLPFARLRQQNKPFRFALIKLVGIFMNIVLNVLFLLIFPKYFPGLVDPTIGIGYVFLANLAASGITLVLLIPELRSMKFDIDKALIREMLMYGFPILIAGFAGMINETLDRAILKYLITDKSIAMEQLGIYSACYKLSILMTLFVQTFRYAADPFIFPNNTKKTAENYLPM
ncbi:MAG: oligosaccharide flippase family protein [Bacteroidetes bacterium]|nr:oligosaccharide flippase family protein [Bacteroidota bacterium]